jgi:hypothetical protein
MFHGQPPPCVTMILGILWEDGQLRCRRAAMKKLGLTAADAGAEGGEPCHAFQNVLKRLQDYISWDYQLSASMSGTWSHTRELRTL